jgi:hypothetical protein
MEHMNTSTGETIDVAGNPLARKIARIIGQVGKITKNGHNAFHGYSYANESDLLDAVRQHVADANIAIIPSVLPETYVVTPGQGRNHDEIVTSCLVQFTVIDGDSGVREVGCYPGAGSDKLDKGAYKAMTGAEKYFLQKLFLIPTGDDPEKANDADGNGNVRPVGAAQQATRPVGAPVQQPRPTQAAPAATRPVGVTSAPAATPTSSQAARPATAPASAPQAAPPARPVSTANVGPVQQRKAELEAAVANVARPAAASAPARLFRRHPPRRRRPPPPPTGRSSTSRRSNRSASAKAPLARPRTSTAC